ncbi:MAG: divalent-cation tolerance protein CutA [Alphaproteobacteria bacterium]|nr:divalent-cation tolerance protein CutA [Alphaproteobacteria bacterium]MBV9061443.1 divalent-cation tolerance protein CutA [Alphaproteobacteria bacterium]
MNGSEFVFVYSTFPDEAAARRVGEALVRQKLAACVNIYPPMHSIYEWEGKLESAAEISAFIKTRRAKVDAVIAAAQPLHPYTVPCFLVLPIEDGNEDYLAWARAQTTAASHR